MVDIHEVAPYHPDADRFAHEPGVLQARVGHDSDDAVMVQFAEELIQRALSRHGDELRFFLAQPCSVPDTWSSLCAGTDSPSLGIEYVRQAVCKLIPNSTWVPTQTYAAEHNRRKRKFIQCVHAGRLSVLFGDIFEIVDGRATSWDYVGGRNISRPSAKVEREDWTLFQRALNQLIRMIRVLPRMTLLAHPSRSRCCLNCTMVAMAAMFQRFIRQQFDLRRLFPLNTRLE